MGINENMMVVFSVIVIAFLHCSTDVTIFRYHCVVSAIIFYEAYIRYFLLDFFLCSLI